MTETLFTKQQLIYIINHNSCILDSVNLFLGLELRFWTGEKFCSLGVKVELRYNEKFWQNIKVL